MGAVDERGSVKERKSRTASNGGNLYPLAPARMALRQPSKPQRPRRTTRPGTRMLVDDLAPLALRSERTDERFASAFVGLRLRHRPTRGASRRSVILGLRASSECQRIGERLDV